MSATVGIADNNGYGMRINKKDGEKNNNNQTNINDFILNSHLNININGFINENMNNNEFDIINEVILLTFHCYFIDIL